MVQGFDRKEIVGNSFADFDEEITVEQIDIVKKCVNKIAKEIY